MTATVTQLYSAGYEGMDHATFIATVQARDFMVMDVRFTPSSRNPDWSRSRLSKALGERYVHVPELGNRNYRGDMGSGIIIANADVGLARLALELSRKSVVLLCVCSNWKTCHRTEVVRQFQLTRPVEEQVFHLDKRCNVIQPSHPLLGV